MANSPSGTYLTRRNFLAASTFPLLAAAQTRRLAAKDRTVIVISLDGIPGWAWDDPRMPAPNLLKLAKEGVLGEGMTPPNPTVTWPSHTTMVTGVSPAKHGVLYNGLPVRLGERQAVRVEPWRPKDELVLTPTVYDKAFAAGLTTAQVDWVAISEPKTITWQFPEIPDPDGPLEKELVADGVMTREEVEEFRKSNPAWRDLKWTQAGAYIIRKHKPNLLLFHLLNTDAINHNSGPKTMASHTAYALADAHTATLLRAVEDAGLKDRTTFLIVSDHGFKTAQKIIKPNAILRREGLLGGSAMEVVCDVYVVPEGGTAMVYVTNSQKRNELLARALEMFRNVEGVETVLAAKDFAAYGYPQPEPGGRMADLVLAARDGYAFSGSSNGEAIVPAGGTNGSPGNHGYLNTLPELRTTFIASGYGIQQGKKIGRINAADIAPTIAFLLGVDMGKVEGRVLNEILTPDAAPAAR